MTVIMLYNVKRIYFVSCDWDRDFESCVDLNDKIVKNQIKLQHALNVAMGMILLGLMM